VQEWFNVVLRKAAVPLKPREATSLYRALDLHRDHSFSWWDSLIVSAAIQGGWGQLF
jgi:predicted nucleic acid-binding protein